MANRRQANIPKFGEWKNGATSTPYTVVFDKARHKKTDPNFNPNDPNQFNNFVEERPEAPKPNTRPPRQMKDGTGERKEERRYPASTRPQAYGHQGEDAQVPQFGIWNNTNASGYDFTGQFDKVGAQRNREREHGASPQPHTDRTHLSPYAMGSTSRHKTHKVKCVIL